MSHFLSFAKAKLWFLLSFGLLLIFVGLFSPKPLAANNGQLFFSLNGTLAVGQTIQPLVPIFGTPRDFNFALTIVGGGPVELTIFDSNSQVVWTGTARSGETLWGTGTLTVGQNSFTLTNNGSASSDFSLKMYNLPTAPFIWEGMAAAVGLFSEVRVIFPSSGLYTFDLGVDAGKYQFFVNDAYIQKTAVANTSVTYFVPAGTHTLAIVQDATAGASWGVDISGPGAAADALPYTKTGTGLLGSDPRFREEWLPISLATASQVNLALNLTGNAAETLTLDVTTPGTRHNEAVLDAVYGGELIWATLDLPAGVSLIRLTAANSNTAVMSYSLTVDLLPAPSYTWQGKAHPAGLNSESRVTFPSSGLYTFSFAVASGRYQFQVNQNFLLKTIEQTDSVTYYIPAGTHTLNLIQDSSLGAADWSVTITAGPTTPDMLPYAKMGGNLGGLGNDFNQEWLPIALDTAQTVNLELTATGSMTDSFHLEVYYNATGSTTVYTLDNILGSETIWTNFPLTAGLNRLRLIADAGNVGQLSYDLQVTAVPQNGSANWSGYGLANGNFSSIMVNFPQSGLYRFAIENAQGFANLLLDQNMPTRALLAQSDGSYDIMVSAGMHEIFTVQDPAYPATDWSASVMPVTAVASFFNFSGSLQAGESVVSIYPAAAAQPFNLEWRVSGADNVLLAINDADGNPIWQGTAQDGETLWGTDTLPPGNNSLLFFNPGPGSANIELTLYHLPTAPYSWSGVADPDGLNSEIRLSFPNSGLYTFSYETDGLIQFLVNEEFIQKTVPANGSVTYYVPAGTHTLVIDQESGGGVVDWTLNISAVGAATDTLPYTKMGGPLGDSDFDTEWLPIHLSQGSSVNVSFTVTGTAGDSLTFATGNFNVQLFAGETYWASLALDAGTTLFQLLADDANSGALNYEITVYALPALPYVWDGRSTPQVGVNRYSIIQLPFAASGLYTFDFGLDNGRYQFHLNDDYLQKVVDGPSSITAYVPEGIHELVIRQDSVQGADWDVTITFVAATPDMLPFNKMGGALGGTNNEFTTDILPLFTASPAEVNLSLSVTGQMTESLELLVYELQTAAPILSLNPVYGDETLWATFSLPANGVALMLMNDAGNVSGVAYELTVDVVPQITGTAANRITWHGVAASAGLNPTMRLDTAVSGVYLVEVDMPQDGFIAFSVDDTVVRAPQGFFYSFEVPLSAGLHLFVGQQNNAPLTTWILTATLLTADAPQITAVTPAALSTGFATTITLTGSNFMPGATVSLRQGSTIIPLTGVTVVNATTVTAVVPATVAVGVYDLILTNPDAQSATLPEGLTVQTISLYLPVIIKP